MSEPKDNHIWSDDVCIYVSSSVTNPLSGKIALLLADMFILSAVLIAVKEAIPAMFLVTSVFLFYLTKYTLWNFFGKENLIINVKSFSFQHDYGLFRTAYKTELIHNQIILNATNVWEGNTKRLRLIFTSHRELDKIPYRIYTTSFYFSQDEAVYLSELIQKLYLDKLKDEYEFPVICLN